jgi:superfamily I DNA and/or RNA helicase
MAGYVAQVKAIRDAIRDYLHEWTNLTITCNTVDSFQGQQADICIYSVTRSNPEGRLGFLREKPRLNVALSRARDLLIIVGDSQFCKSAEGENPFRTVIDYIEEHSLDCEVKPIHVA